MVLSSGIPNTSMRKRPFSRLNNAVLLISSQNSGKILNRCTVSHESLLETGLRFAIGMCSG
ncbi:MAG TPA: hypothetical protein DCR20_11365 [Planctomycetaceae bacterium]|nr:hypothetical protein [Planctomycetaceae bacterium]